MESLKDIVIIYHANCLDGFGAAYAAWKKFGESASYIPTKTQEKVPEGLVDKEIYILDYCYSKEGLDSLNEDNKSVTVIDHHATAQEAATAYQNSVFDLKHSGAFLSWQYFHPQDNTPKLLLHIEDSDLWKFDLPETKAIVAHLWQKEFDFKTWDNLVQSLENESDYKEFIEKGENILAQKNIYIQGLLTYAEKVNFDGHQCLAVNCARPYRSDIGNLLAEKTGTLGIVWYHYEGSFHFSLRSKGDFDVSKIAEKYGGGGHKNAASIRFKDFSEAPIKFI